MLKRLIVYLTAIIFLSPVPAMPDLKTYRESLGGSDPYVPFDYELPLLPSYCTCKLRSDDPRWRRKCYKWQDKFRAYGARGRDVVHIHHYCSGLLMLRRVQRGVGERSALLKKAERQFNYMITHSSPKFILMPEIYSKMGMTQIMLEQSIKAMEYFKRAISLKNNYVPAYLQLIDLYVRSQNINGAISTAKMGLKYSPNSKQLQKKLAELQSLSQ